MKFDPAEADEGLYFVATAGGETKVTTVQKNKPSQLVFLVPAAVAWIILRRIWRRLQGKPVCAEVVRDKSREP